MAMTTVRFRDVQIGTNPNDISAMFKWRSKTLMRTGALTAAAPDAPHGKQWFFNPGDRVQVEIHDEAEPVGFPFGWLGFP